MVLLLSSRFMILQTFWRENPHCFAILSMLSLELRWSCSITFFSSWSICFLLLLAIGLLPPCDFLPLPLVFLVVVMSYQRKVNHLVCFSVYDIIVLKQANTNVFIIISHNIYIIKQNAMFLRIVIDNAGYLLIIFYDFFLRERGRNEHSSVSLLSLIIPPLFTTIPTNESLSHPPLHLLL